LFKFYICAGQAEGNVPQVPAQTSKWWFNLNPGEKILLPELWLLMGINIHLSQPDAT
jgi:hypothetical protein